MKQILLTFVVWLCCLGASAQTNFALNCATSASSQNGDNTAAKAVDGKNGTRWESAQTDDEWWSVDLGEARTFDMIVIRWEGAYAKSFRIVAGNNADFSDAVTVVEKENESISNLNQIYNFNEVTARYVKFESTKAATGYGVKLYEFAVYADASDGELEKDPEVDTKTGAYHLYGVLNSSTADLFDSDNSVAYDMTAVTIPAAIVVTAQNPNAMFIVTDEQKTLLSGTKNLVVKSATATRRRTYNSLTATT